MFRGEPRWRPGPCLAWVCTCPTGRTRPGTADVDQLEALSKRSFVTAFFVALVYAGLEDKDQAFLWLEKACEERFNRLAYLKVEALWDPLRSDPRFAELLRRVGIPG